MKCWTFSRGDLIGTTNAVPLHQGIRVEPDHQTFLEEGGKPPLIIRLGGFGSGRQVVKVPISRANPPTVMDRLGPKPHILHAGIWKEKGDGPAIIAKMSQAKSENDRSALLRVDTKGQTRTGTKGIIKRVSGTPWLIGKGVGGVGDIFPMGTWEEALVVIHPGDVLRIRPEHWSETDSILLAHRICDRKLVFQWVRDEEQNKSVDIYFINHLLYDANPIFPDGYVELKKAPVCPMHYAS